MGDLLGRFGGGSLLDNVLSPQPTDLSRGNHVLGEIFGSKDVSRTVAENAAERSGLQPSLLKKDADARDDRGGLHCQAARRRCCGARRRSPLPAAPSRGGGLGSMLDLDGNGNALDDILRMAGRR